MSPTVVTKIVLAMLLWAACFPLITVGLIYAPHLSFATLRLSGWQWHWGGHFPVGGACG